MFAITADQLQEAHNDGIKVASGAAVELIVAHVNNHLIERSQKMRSGEDVSTLFTIVIDRGVTHFSQVHEEAVKLAVKKLQEAGFKAQYILDCWDQDAIQITV